MDGRLWTAEAHPERKKGSDFDAVIDKFGALHGGEMQLDMDDSNDYSLMPELADWWSDDTEPSGSKRQAVGHGRSIGRGHQACKVKAIGHGQCSGPMLGAMGAQEYSYGERIRSRATVEKYRKAVAEVEERRLAERKQRYAPVCISSSNHSYGYEIRSGGASVVKEAVDLMGQQQEVIKLDDDGDDDDDDVQDVQMGARVQKQEMSEQQEKGRKQRKFDDVQQEVGQMGGKRPKFDDVRQEHIKHRKLDDDEVQMGEQVEKQEADSKEGGDASGGEQEVVSGDEVELVDVEEEAEAVQNDKESIDPLL